MDFIHWWLDTHWFVATVFTPGLAFLYAIFTEQAAWVWGIVAYFLAGKFLLHILKAYGE